METSRGVGLMRRHLRCQEASGKARKRGHWDCRGFGLPQWSWWKQKLPHGAGAPSGPAVLVPPKEVRIIPLLSVPVSYTS